MNPLLLPLDIGASLFNSRDHFENEELVLTPSMRAAHNATLGLYYLCVFGNTAATYKLTVLNKDHETFLSSGLAESGYASPAQIQSFFFRDPILTQEGVNLTFQLHVMLGKARLRAKICEVSHTERYEEFKYRCAMTFMEMNKEDPEEKNEAHIGSEVLQTDTGKCKVPPEGAPRDAQVSCVVVAAVMGMEDYVTHFSVLLKVETEVHHTLLKEGVPVFNEVKESTPYYYRATINDPAVTKVTF